MVNKFTNKRSLINKRTNLRKHATKAAREVWKYLRNKQLAVKFRRQYSINSYIVDFFCYELNLIIEIDGGIHGEKENNKKDRKREAWLQSQGDRIVRYTNEQVLNDMEHVYTDIQRTITNIQKDKEFSPL